MKILFGLLVLIFSVSLGFIYYRSCRRTSDDLVEMFKREKGKTKTKEKVNKTKSVERG